MKNKLNVFSIVVGILLGIYVLSLMLIFLWALNTSVKSADDFDFNVVGLVKEFTFDNYLTAYQYGFNIQVVNGASVGYVYIEQMFLYSILYAGGSAVSQVFCTCIVAYLIVKYNNAFSKLMNNIIVFTMILPIIGATPSMIIVMDALNLRNTLIGMYVMKFGFSNIYYLIFYGAFKSLSNGYSEAALIDGANHFQIFFKIMLPLVSSLFGVVTLIFFIQYWNDFQEPMLFLEYTPVLAYGLYIFFRSYDQVLSSTVVKVAGGIIVLLPILILFISARNKLMGNLTEGGLKG